LISLAPTYPEDSPPQLQLLSRYIGAFGVDSNLFGSVLRTYISSSGVEWTQGGVCVFDGLQDILDRCTQWYEEHLSLQKAGELLREDAAEPSSVDPVVETPAAPEPDPPSDPGPLLPSGVEIFEAEAIHDRRSIFIGRACVITDPAQVSNLNHQ
jgi:hypothetical protein